MAVVAKAGIQQRFTRNDVRCPLRTDRERSSIRNEGNRGLPQSSHGTSVLTPNGGARRGALSENSPMRGGEPASRLPVFSPPLPRLRGGVGAGVLQQAPAQAERIPPPGASRRPPPQAGV